MTDSAAAGPGREGLSTRHILAATLGNGLEFYDFVTYAAFAISIGHAFYPTGAFASLMLSLATFGAGFLTRPLGALVIGAYGDRVGRRPAMMLSFGLMGGSVLFLALIPPYALIGPAAPVLALLARLVQGFSLGGEVGPNIAYLVEASPARHRGLAVSLQGVSQQVAVMSGATVGLILSFCLSHAALDAYGWRIAFVIGSITLPVGLWLRRDLPETLHTPEDAPPAPLASRLAGLRVIVACLLMLSCATIATYMNSYMTTFAQASLHKGVSLAFAASILPALFSLPVLLWGASLSDRIGRRPVMLASRAATVLATLPLYYWIVSAHSAIALLTGGILITALQAPATATLFSAMSEALPKANRGMAVALMYALAIAVFGGTAQLVVTWLIHVTGNPMALSWYLMAANVAGLIGALLIPESAPLKLEQLQATERLRSA